MESHRQFELPDKELVEQTFLPPDLVTVWAGSLGTLIGCGVPILDCFRALNEINDNPAFCWLNVSVHNAVRQGDGLAASMWKDSSVRGKIDPLLISMIDLGEVTGTLDQVLAEYAEQKMGNEKLSHSLSRSTELKWFTLRLSKCFDAGLPIVRSLQMAEQDPYLVRAHPEIAQIRTAVEGGDSLHEAMKGADTPVLDIDELYLKHVFAGEIGGVLDIIMQRLSEQCML